jgi:anti-sigma B factor antagonist
VPVSIADLPPAFTVAVEPDRDLVVLRPAGELDLTTVPLVETELRALRDAGFDRVVVDLRDLAFVDSTGLALLLAWHAEGGLTLELLPGPAHVMRVVELSGVSDVVPVLDRRRFERFR